MLEKLTSDHFKPYLNQTFRIYFSETEHVDMQLTTVSDLDARPREETARRAFSLIFRGSRDGVLPQRIYHVEHRELGPLDIFLVPVGHDKEGIQYEALFA